MSGYILFKYEKGISFMSKNTLSMDTTPFLSFQKDILTT